jgi:predicted SAM-dependent methyltransferase
VTITTVKRALKKVPPLFHAARAVQSAARTVFGPAWLKWQVERHRKEGRPLRVVIGSSRVYDPGWIPTNFQYLNLLNEAHWQRAFGDQQLDALLAEHVWEHLTASDGKVAAAKCFKALKPGGYLRVAVPDGYHPDPDYIEFVRPGGSGSGAPDHKLLYTHESLTDMLTSAGFDVELLEYYDSEGKFHRKEWDLARGTIGRRYGSTENSPAGRVIQFTSLIADAHKPVD